MILTEYISDTRHLFFVVYILLLTKYMFPDATKLCVHCVMSNKCIFNTIINISILF